MTETDTSIHDRELLADLVRERSKLAFDEIVHRYVHLVHAAAYRQTRDTHLAEDVTQAVFLLLWQHASKLNPHTSLPGWLLLTARNFSRNAIKQKSRRIQHESHAMTANPFAINPGNDEILTHLDDAVAQLGETDRDAIIGRYFLSQSMDQIGETLGINSKAAAKRVSRALEKLHSILTRKGVSADQAALSALLPMIALQPHASSTVISNVLSGSSSAASVNALLKTAATSKSATLVASVIATVLLAATTTIAILSHHPRAGSPLLLPVAQAAIPVLAANPPAAPDNEGRTVTLIMVDPKTNAPIKNAQVEVKEQNNPAVTEPADETERTFFTFRQHFNMFEFAVSRQAGQQWSSISQTTRLKVIHRSNTQSRWIPA